MQNMERLNNNCRSKCKHAQAEIFNDKYAEIKQMQNRDVYRKCEDK